jgi:hypothetical protein
LAFLAYATAIVTTPDSISMVTEAVMSRKPVFVLCADQCKVRHREHNMTAYPSKTDIVSYGRGNFRIFIVFYRLQNALVPLIKKILSSLLLALIIMIETLLVLVVVIS